MIWPDEWTGSRRGAGRTAAMILMMLGLLTPVCAEETLAYGSRAGMEVSVVSASGLDTDTAVIRTKHTRSNAITFCRDYVGKVTPTCIREELAVPLKERVTADCSTGLFTTPSGERFRFEGKLKAASPIAKYRVVDLSTGLAADGTSASGYSTNLSIFRALCPKHAPHDE